MAFVHIIHGALRLLLALIVDLPPLLFLLAVTRNSSTYTANSTLRPVHHPLSQILKLALGFLGLTLLVLVDSSAPEALVAGYITD